MFNKLHKSVGDALEFSPDVTGKGPRITIMGREQVIIENYLSIIDFSREKIHLDTSEGELCISGTSLFLNSILPTELRIAGEFISLAYGEADRHD